MNWRPSWTTIDRYVDLTDFENEIWLPFLTLRGKDKLLQPYYYISNLGRLKSFSIHNRPRILPGTYDKTTGGYVATMVRTVDGKQFGMSYHLQVAYYFLGDTPSSMIDPTVDHINCDRCDNRWFNLQWLERPDNSKKAIQDGLCSAFMSNGGWNRQHCYFKEYPDVKFQSYAQAATFIGRNTDYVAECVRLNRKILHSQGYELHVILGEDK